MIGPFFYINSKELNYNNYLFSVISLEDAETYGNFLTSSYSHAKLFDSKFPKAEIEYYDYPRGRATYNIQTQEHIIYIDKCIENKVSEIAKLFEILNYKIEYDDHYVCKKCVGKSLYIK